MVDGMSGPIPRVVVVGYGYWGPNLVRNLAHLNGEPLHGVCDSDWRRLEMAKRQYSWIKTYSTFDEVLTDDAVDAVAIATPAASHFSLCMAALQAGKHVLVEKPLATSTAESMKLIAYARQRGLVLLVGHTFLYVPAVSYLRALIEAGDLGRLHYMYASRLNLGVYRPDVNVLWDLAPHDVAITLYLTGEHVTAVSARGFRHAGVGTEDVAFLTLEFESGTSAHIHVSWLDPNKVREMTIVGSQRMAVYNDIDPAMTVRVYDKGVDVEQSADAPSSFGEFKLAVRTGGIQVPHLPPIEPLRAECQNFLNAVTGQEEIVSTGELGLEVVSVLEAAQLSMSNLGERVLTAAPRGVESELIA